jgi:trypsin-like peptidase
MQLAIDEFSLTTVPIDLHFNGQPLSKGTAFTWERDNKHYLITNWHNVSGRNPNNDRHLSPTAAEPNILYGSFNTKGKNIGDKDLVRIYIRQDSGEANWLVHPTHKRKIDVVAIPLTGDFVSSIHFYSINKMGSPDLLVGIGMDVFVLGYPFGPGKTGLPVWKRGSIASEPDLVPHVEKYLLVDTASRPGMSGSPVILRSYGTHVSRGGVSLTLGAANKFIGVYSGRLHTQDPLDRADRNGLVSNLHRRDHRRRSQRLRVGHIEAGEPRLLS